MNLLQQWNENKFSIYQSEEKTTLKLIEALSKYTGLVIQDQETLNKAMVELQAKVNSTSNLIGENVVDLIDEMVQDGTFEDMVNVGLAENFRPNILPSSINAVSIENRLIDEGYESIQGGCYHNGLLYYWLISDSNNKQKLIVYDVENNYISRTKEYSNLGHCSDCCIYNNVMYLTSNQTGVIYEIDLITLLMKTKSLSGVGLCQGIAIKGDQLIIKEDDNLTIKIYDLKLNNVIKSFTLQIPQKTAIYKQGIDVIGNYIIDVRGLPASGYFYDIENGDFISSFKFDVVDSLQYLGENEFLANDGKGKFYFGAYGTYNGNVLLTTGIVDIKSTLVDTTPFISNNLSGVDSIYLNSDSTETQEDGTQNYPFKTLEKALIILGERKIKRLRIIGGTYDNFTIQHKGTIEIFFSNNAKVNGMTINYSDVTINNLNMKGRLLINNSTLHLNGSVTIDGVNDYCINGNYSMLFLTPSSTTTLTTTKAQNTKANKCIVLCTTSFKIEGVNYSIITNNITQTTYPHNLDNTCIYMGKTITGITALYKGSFSLDTVPVHTEIQVRARSGDYSANMTVSQLSSSGSSRKNVINFYIEVSGVPHLCSICFTFSNGTITINHNKLINLVTGAIQNYSSGTGNFAYIDQISFSR